MEGFLGKMAVSLLLVPAFQPVIHLMKGIILLFVLIFVILEIDMKLKISIQKCIFLDYIFQTSISQLILYSKI